MVLRLRQRVYPGSYHSNGEIWLRIKRGKIASGELKMMESCACRLRWQRVWRWHWWVKGKSASKSRKGGSTSSSREKLLASSKRRAACPAVHRSWSDERAPILVKRPAMAVCQSSSGQETAPEAGSATHQFGQSSQAQVIVRKPQSLSSGANHLRQATGIQNRPMASSFLRTIRMAKPRCPLMAELLGFGTRDAAEVKMKEGAGFHEPTRVLPIRLHMLTPQCNAGGSEGSYTARYGASSFEEQCLQKTC